MQAPGDMAHQAGYDTSASQTTLEKTANPHTLDTDKQPVDYTQQGSAAEPQASTALADKEAARPAAGHDSPVPNGGLQAWLQVVGAFMIFFNTWGILNTFGVFQTYYETGQLFRESSSNISWIGSIQAYCVLLGGLVTGSIYDNGHLRPLLVVGGFGVVFGHMMLSLVHTYWQALLAQGFCIGLGAGCMFVPALAVLPTYFNTHLGLAVGLGAAGSSFGGIIYPIVFYRLIDQIGFGWSVRVLGFIALATMLVPISVMKQRVRPQQARALIDVSAFTDWPYVTFVLGAMIGFIGLYVMLFYISFYAQVRGITDSSLSFYLVAILNATSMFGRTLPNALADKTGPLNLIVPGAIICGVLNIGMIGVNNVGGIVVMALLFGFFSGVFIALPPLLFVALTKDKSKIGTRMGMGFAAVGLGALIGGPGGGAILGSGENMQWTGAWLFGGIANIVAGLIFAGLRVHKAGLKLRVKV